MARRTRLGSGAACAMSAVVASAVMLLCAGAALAAPHTAAGSATFIKAPGSPFSTGSGTNSVAFSPSGKLLASANGSDGTLSVFSVDPSTGALTPVPGSPFAIATGTGAGPVAFSPSGNLLATTTCTSTNHGNCFANAIAVFSVDPTTGALSEVPGSPFASGKGADFLAFSPTGNLLAADGGSDPFDDDLSIFSVDPASGSLTPVAGSPFATSASPWQLAFNPSGNLLATTYVDHGVAVFSVNPSTGAIAPVSGSPFTAGPSPESLQFNASGTQLAAVNVQNYTLSMFSVDSSTGGLTQVGGSPFKVGIGPLAVAFSPAGNLVAVTAGGGGGGTQVFSVDPASGELTELPGSPFATGSEPVAVTFSPSGHLLATANGPANGPGSVSIFVSASGSSTGSSSTGSAGTGSDLSRSLAVHGSAASITGLLRTGKVSLSVVAPGAGRERIVWEQTRRGQKHTLIIGSGSQSFRTAGTATVVIHLGHAGRAALEHARRVTLTAVGSFTPTGGASVTVRKQIELHR